MTELPISTESADARFAQLDALAPESALSMLWESQLAAVAAVGPALPAIAAAAEAAAMRLTDGRLTDGRLTDGRLTDGGRLIYTGAGTSGRIAVQDGAELWPTFGWPEARLLLLPAGGSAALLHAIESAEDDLEAAALLVERHEIGGPDVVLGVAASGTTPYTLGLLSAARKNGALTIGVANSPGTGLLAVAEFPILAATGAEPIAGSTRLKAGTAQKVILNLFSTLLMTRLNRVYRGRMVDLELTSAKLGRRARRMVSELAGVDAAAAEALLRAADGSVKRALLLARGLQPAAAADLLERHRGNLRAAVAELDRAEPGAPASQQQS